MQYLRRIKRRASGYFWGFYEFILNRFRWVRFRFDMYILQVSEKYVWEAFSYLAGLDMEESFHTPSGVEVQGYGVFLEIVDRKRLQHFTFEQNERNQLVIFQERPETREVRMEFNSVVKTKWWEVYRSGRHVEEAAILAFDYLKTLYGEGPNAIQERETEGLHVRHAP